jgi:hypothetical protein
MHRRQWTVHDMVLAPLRSEQNPGYRESWMTSTATCPVTKTFTPAQNGQITAGRTVLSQIATNLEAVVLD